MAQPSPHQPPPIPPQRSVRRSRYSSLRALTLRQFETEKCQFETEKCQLITEKCQLRTENCQLRTEKCQFRTEKCQWVIAPSPPWHCALRVPCGSWNYMDQLQRIRTASCICTATTANGKLTGNEMAHWSFPVQCMQAWVSSVSRCLWAEG